MCVQQCCVLPLNIIYLNFFSRVFSGVLIFFFNLYLLCYFWLKSSFTLFLDTFATLKRIQSGFFFSLWRTTCWKKMDITKKKKKSWQFCRVLQSDRQWYHYRHLPFKYLLFPHNGWTMQPQDQDIWPGWKWQQFFFVQPATRQKNSFITPTLH